LSKLDLSQYYKVCKTEDDSPKWHKELHQDLTEEQIIEAKKFGRIMSQCFQTSGQNCKCEEIPYPEFSRACSQAAPLAVACDIEGDEIACEKLDDLDMPELPDHLQDIFDELDEDVGDTKFDLHAPRECVEAGVTTREECGRVMIETHSPPECKEALLAANVQNEREGRAICEKIMMKIHAPECSEKGITSPQECEKFMRSRGPGFDDRRGPGPGFNIDFNCREINDPNERLNCFDKASSQTRGFQGFDDSNYDGPCMTDNDWKVKKAECRAQFGEHAGDEPIMGESGQGYECPIDIKCVDFGQFKDDDYNMRFEELKEREMQCSNQCQAEGKPWDFRNGVCICKDVEHFEGGPYDGPIDDYEESQCKDGCSDECPGASRTDCVDNGMRCACYYEDDFSGDSSDGGHVDEPYTEPDSGSSDSDSSDNGEVINIPDDSSSDSGTSDSSSSGDGGSSSSDSGSSDSDSGSSDSSSSDSSGDSGGSDSGTSDTSSADSSSSNSDGGEVTGEFVKENEFLDYYYN
tara:strand:+ start:5508 stop:7070 length:1563 start_codon:yes stop_codon:yes gene_type:complete